MCDALEPYESYQVCELIHQLGALYDKGRKAGADRTLINGERRHVSDRLLKVTSRLEPWRGLSPARSLCTRES